MNTQTSSYRARISPRVYKIAKIIKQNKRVIEDNQLGHEPVQPLWEEDHILTAQKYFLSRPERFTSLNLNLRDYTIFTLNINIGLRCTDLCNLKVGYVMNSDGTIKDSFFIKEQKTHNSKACKKEKSARLIVLRPAIKDMLKKWIDTLPQTDNIMDQYLFISRNKKPLTRQQMWTIMQGLKAELQNQFNSYKDVNIATHSMRKTFALQMYKDIIANYPDEQYALEILSEILGHEDVATTRRYIGLTNKKKKELWINTKVVGQMLI